jgi:hypothetical protein
MKAEIDAVGTLTITPDTPAEAYALRCWSRSVLSINYNAPLPPCAEEHHNCPTHGQQPDNAWGCPECVRELRREDERLRSAMPTAREAVKRLVRWNLEAYNSEVVRGVYLWATLNGMAGPLPPLPPLPEWVAKREQLQVDPEDRC